MDVVLNARRADKLDAVADRVRTLGRQAETVGGDVTDPDMSARLLDTALARFDRFDVVFANAGYGIDKAADATSMAELRAIFDVNFFAACDLLNQAVRRWRESDTSAGDGDKGRGTHMRHLLMCSSCAAKFTLPYHAAYTATKAAQNHVCRAMRMELKTEGIEVASVHPITTTSEFWDAMAAYDGTPGQTPQLRRKTPRPFVQTPDRVARAIVRCLRRPRPEVWTSHAVRLMAAMFTACPRLQDFAMRGRLRRKT